ncbi:NAD-dependent epimerase/dehydratase family protein [Blautia sp. BIOML-A1]|uniref:GDP-mannose 4,6-dehydratase n=1 Tax=Blautia sp. BIOML-A1 TaxID=2584624 RepID=UPI00136D6E82|nr:GDP-mannose 4,6-dehydratase [Blautia sp. BIOML-A1]MZT66425.1 NAD-dependent epimerase/dehydratase family protein [Blautia sp. BIOML-A1]
MILQNFVESMDELDGDVTEYVDDGHTGTNFNRPAFQAMVEDAKRGKIEVILVKDLSRIGRDYIGVGDYLEQIFPILGVRVIAVNSQYDSNNYIGNTMGLEMSISKVYQASTSELYGKVEEVPQRETTPFHPYSPYAVAKQYGFWMVKEYRDAYGMFAVNGILFNHESERRGENFVTRKITLAAGRIAEGLQDHLELGNMNSLRDWGYAKDYVECMWLIMQQDKPEDFVIATGVQHTVRDFTEKAFAANGITIRWEGSGIEEKGYDVATGKMLVCVNPQWFRPTDVDNLWGDPTKAKTVLGWNPQSTTYEQLVEIMARHDRERAKREKAMKAVL